MAVFGFFGSAMQRRFEWCDLSEVPFLKSDPGRGGAAGYPGQNHPRPGDGSRSLRVSPRLDLQSAKGDTALVVAAWGGHVDAVRQLIVAGADLDIPGEYGKTARQWARQRGKHDAAALLEAAGAL